ASPHRPDYGRIPPAHDHLRADRHRPPGEQPQATGTYNAGCCARRRPGGSSSRESRWRMSLEASVRTVPGLDARSQELMQRNGSRRQVVQGAQRRAKMYDRIATGVMLLVVAFLVIVLIGVVASILIKGVRQLSWTFITTSSSLTQPGGGVGPQLWCTMY